MNLGKAIRMCLDSGQVKLGLRTALKDAMLGHGKLIVIARNLPAPEASDIFRYCALSNIALVTFEGTSMELGSVCGKPFSVSALVIMDVGNSPIMNLVK